MSKKYLVRTIAIFALAVLLILPLFLPLFKFEYGGSLLNGGDFFAGNKTSVYRPSVYEMYGVKDASYGVFDDLSKVKFFCGDVFAKDGTFVNATLVKVFIVLTAICAIILAVINLLRFFGLHLNVLEDFFAKLILIFMGVILLFALFFFMGTTARFIDGQVDGKDNKAYTIKSIAQIGFYIATLGALAMGSLVLAFKPYEEITEK